MYLSGQDCGIPYSELSSFQVVEDNWLFSSCQPNRASFFLFRQFHSSDDRAAPRRRKPGSDRLRNRKHSVVPTGITDLLELELNRILSPLSCGALSLFWNKAWVENLLPRYISNLFFHQSLEGSLKLTQEYFSNWLWFSKIIVLNTT